MYIILVNDDNTLVASVKERIMQRSKLVDELCFLAKPTYKGYDMSQFTVMLEYLAPVSKKYRTEILVPAESTYKDHLMYTLPVDTAFTAEAGKVELQLSFVMVDLDENGKSIQRVRKTSKTHVEIFPITAWSDIIPDDVLTPLDQRIIMVNAQQRAMEDMINSYYATKADGIKYDEDDNTLQLTADETVIGNKVRLKNTGGSGGGGATEEGIPAVDFNEIVGDTVPEPEKPDTPDIPSGSGDKDVVEF